jgi:hypothetical protein
MSSVNEIVNLFERIQILLTEIRLEERRMEHLLAEAMLREKKTNSLRVGDGCINSDSIRCVTEHPPRTTSDLHGIPQAGVK